MRRRRGLTLIELLVVVMIIGLLLALVVPAVQSGRESARRTVCRNNLRGIDAAVLQHATAEQALPSLYNGSFLPQPRQPMDEFFFHSWRSTILQLIEQPNVSASLNFALPATIPANQTAVNVAVGVFLCPSSSNPHQNVPDVGEFQMDWARPLQGKSVGTAARNDYEVVGGVRVGRPQRPAANVGDHILVGVEFGAWGEPTYASTGAATCYRRARLADVTDGLTSTILVGERAGRPDSYEKGRSVEPYPYSDPMTQGGALCGAAWGISAHFPYVVYADKQPLNFTNRTGIFSFHSGGAHVALGDGSVRFLTDSTAPAILKALATRAGSEFVDFD